MQKECENCKKILDVSFSEKLGKYICHPCYKKLLWKPQIIKCTRCSRLLPMHAKGMCAGCYNSTFHIDKVRLQNAKRRHNVDGELYLKVIAKCVICEFDKIIDLHHLDHNHLNSSPTNLIGLCPNHHKMIHSKKYQKEIFDILKEKGFNVPESNLSDGFFKKPFEI